jgi:hypothetical protein
MEIKHKKCSDHSINNIVSLKNHLGIEIQIQIGVKKKPHDGKRFVQSPAVVDSRRTLQETFAVPICSLLPPVEVLPVVWICRLFTQQQLPNELSDKPKCKVITNYRLGAFRQILCLIDIFLHFHLYIIRENQDPNTISVLIFQGE